MSHQFGKSPESMTPSNKQEPASRKRTDAERLLAVTEIRKITIEYTRKMSDLVNNDVISMGDYIVTLCEMSCDLAAAAISRETQDIAIALIIERINKNVENILMGSYKPWAKHYKREIMYVDEEGNEVEPPTKQ